MRGEGTLSCCQAAMLMRSIISLLVHQMPAKVNERTRLCASGTVTRWWWGNVLVTRPKSAPQTIVTPVAQSS